MPKKRLAPWATLPLSLKAQRLGMTVNSDGTILESDQYAQPILAGFTESAYAHQFLDGFKLALDLVKANQQLKQEAA